MKPCDECSNLVFLGASSCVIDAESNGIRISSGNILGFKYNFELIAIVHNSWQLSEMSSKVGPQTIGKLVVRCGGTTLDLQFSLTSRVDQAYVRHNYLSNILNRCASYDMFKVWPGAFCDRISDENRHT